MPYHKKDEKLVRFSMNICEPVRDPFQGQMQKAKIERAEEIAVGCKPPPPHFPPLPNLMKNSLLQKMMVTEKFED